MGNVVAFLRRTFHPALPLFNSMRALGNLRCIVPGLYSSNTSPFFRGCNKCFRNIHGSDTRFMRQEYRSPLSSPSPSLRRDVTVVRVSRLYWRIASQLLGFMLCRMRFSLSKFSKFSQRIMRKWSAPRSGFIAQKSLLKREDELSQDDRFVRNRLWTQSVCCCGG